MLRGDADEDLLDSYEAERRPGGVLTMGQAMARFGARMGPDGGHDLIDYGAVAMGYRYPTSSWATLARSRRRTFVRARNAGPTCPAARRAGTDHDTRLLRRPMGAARRCCGGPWRAAADHLRMPVAVHSLGADALTMFGVTPEGASLVRPDGFVSWRSAAAVQDAGRALAGMLDRALARS